MYLRGGTCIIIEGHFDDGRIFCFVLIQTGKPSNKNGRRNKFISERRPKSSLFNRQYTQNVQNS